MESSLWHGETRATESNVATLMGKAAVAHAERVVVWVSFEPVPDEVLAFASSHGKRIIPVDPDRFSEQERELLTHHHVYRTDDPTDDPRPSSRVLRAIRRHQATRPLAVDEVGQGCRDAKSGATAA